MSDKHDRLESMGLHVSDGAHLDWEALAKASADEGDEELIRNLRSLSEIGAFFRERHHEADVLSHGRRWGHLEILEHVGRGSYADVYRARDTQLNRAVALKLVRVAPGVQERLPSIGLEGERLARVRHPHLVVIHGAAVHEGALGLWMEFVEGVTLQDLVSRQGPLGAREAVLLGTDLCGALAALHGAGLMHRDVKAQNVMREKGGRTVLMDLGAGADLDPAARAGGEDVSGTPLYMAPEVLRGERGDVRADLYSLGVLLYFAVTGDYPVRADSLEELRRKHAAGRRRHLRDRRPDLPASFVAVIERALSPNPDERFESAGAMERALTAGLGLADEWIEEGAAGSHPPVGRRRLPRWLAWSTAAGVLAVLVLVLIATRGLAPWSPAVYTVSASLHRLTASGDELLLSGARVSPGDRLYLSFEASRAMHVYVLAEDDRGAAFLLHPLPEQEQANPLPGGRPHRLPPSRHGRAMSWGVSSAGGREHIVIVASPNALAEFEQALADLPVPQEAEAPALQLDRQALASLRGIGLLVEDEAPSDPARNQAVFAMVKELAGDPESHEGVWVRQIDLANPGP